MVNLSIIICAYNCESYIQQCLLSIINQENHSLITEIIIINNNSTDQTVSIIKNECHASLAIKLFHEYKQGQAYARKLGVEKAIGQYILFIDADNYLFPDYLYQLELELKQNPSLIGSIGYPYSIELKLHKNYQKHAPSLAIGWPTNDIPYGACLCCKRSVYQKMFLNELPVLSGRIGTQLSSGDDTEIVYLFQLLGYSIKVSEKLKFYHDVNPKRLADEYLEKLFKGFNNAYPILQLYRNLLNKKKGPFLYFKDVGFLLKSLFLDRDKENRSQIIQQLLAYVRMFKLYNKHRIKLEKIHNLF